jgi:hypothetical protein
MFNIKSITNIITITYLLNAILYLNLLIKCFHVKNGIGLKLLQFVTGGLFFLCISVGGIRLLACFNFINLEQVMAYTLIPCFSVTVLGFYLNWLFNKKN